MPMKGETCLLIKVKSCNALLRTPLTCSRSYVKSILRHKFLILIPIISLYLREQGCWGPWLHLSQKGSASKDVWGTLM